MACKLRHPHPKKANLQVPLRFGALGVISDEPKLLKGILVSASGATYEGLTLSTINLQKGHDPYLWQIHFDLRNVEGLNLNEKYTLLVYEREQPQVERPNITLVQEVEFHGLQPPVGI